MSGVLAMNAVVTYAEDGRDCYTAGIPRLSRTLRRHASTLPLFAVAPRLGRRIDGRENLAHADDFLACPSHRAVPYGFKPFLIRALAARGCTTVLWCDVSVVIRRDPGPVFQIARERGIAVFDNPGCAQNVWTSDDALAAMGCPTDEAAQFMQIMGCVVAVCVEHPLGRKILEEWSALAEDGVTFLGAGGSTRPAFRAHRHDQSALSWLVRKYGVTPVPYGTVYYPPKSEQTPPPGVIFTVEGVGSAKRLRWENRFAALRRLLTLRAQWEGEPAAFRH